MVPLGHLPGPLPVPPLFRLLVLLGRADGRLAELLLVRGRGLGLAEESEGLGRDGLGRDIDRRGVARGREPGRGGKTSNLVAGMSFAAS